jgi:hypothetical protein
MERVCDTCGAKAHFYEQHCKQCGLKLHSRRVEHSSSSPGGGVTPERGHSPASLTGEKKSKRKESEKVATTQELVQEVAAATQNKIRLSVTVHSVAGIRPRHASHRGVKLYWSLRLLSASGKKSQRATTALVAVDVNNQLLMFEESFDFVLEFEGQVLELKLKEIDTMLGYTVQKRDHGCLYWQVYSDKLSKAAMDRRSFRFAFLVFGVCNVFIVV